MSDVQLMQITIQTMKTLNMTPLSTMIEKKHWIHITCLLCKQTWNIGDVLIQRFSSNDFLINNHNHLDMFCEKPENCHLSCEHNVLARNLVKKWYYDYCMNVLHDFAPCSA
jgi:hypothetical protein